MSAPEWFYFSSRMPRFADADRDGEIEALEAGGDSRLVGWGWVATAELWRVNGFIAWRHVAGRPKPRPEQHPPRRIVAIDARSGPPTRSETNGTKP